MIFDRLRWLSFQVKLRGVGLARMYAKKLGESGNFESESSLSDDATYPAFCKNASEDTEAFENFRNSAGYNRILEHVPPILGAEYLRTIKRQNDYVFVRSRYICASDRSGNPRTHNYKGFGSASPTTLRYLKVYADLRNMFGPLEGMEVGEIGIGYGGQCRVIELLDEPKNYLLVDLPEVLALSKRFLTSNGITSGIQVASAFATPEVDLDLVISNYAFSELRRTSQDLYVKNLINRATSGYLTFNSITPREFNSMKPEELAEIVSGTIVKERPLSYPGNKIVVWSK